MRRYALPILSGVLLALAFYPFYVWPLALVAFIPIFYFATPASRTMREWLVGGFLTGIVVGVPLFYYSLAQLGWDQGPVEFVLIVRLLSIPATLLLGVMFALLVALYGRLHRNSVLLAAGAAGALYGLLELAMQWLYQGYYLDAVSHALAPLAGARLLASLGGALFVSVVVVGAQAALAECIHTHKWRAVAALVFGAVLIGVVGVAWFSRAESGGMVQIAVVQSNPHTPTDLRFGVFDGTQFTAPALSDLLKSAAVGADLVAYPFSPVEGVTYVGAAPDVPGVPPAIPLGAVQEWLATTTSASTTLAVWLTNAEGGKLYDQFVYQSNGIPFMYQKQHLYAFSDYSPFFAAYFGIAKSPYEITAGQPQQGPSVGGVLLAGLACSELHQPDYVREQARDSGLILSMGYDAFFPDKLVGNYSLAAARLRAAENGIPVVRANIYGPSALIDARGAVVQELPFGATGVLRGGLSKQKEWTLYSHTGSWPLYLFMAALLLYLLKVRIKNDSDAR